MTASASPAPDHAAARAVADRAHEDLATMRALRLMLPASSYAQLVTLANHEGLSPTVLATQLLTQAVSNAPMPELSAHAAPSVGQLSSDRPGEFAPTGAVATD